MSGRIPWVVLYIEMKMISGIASSAYHVISRTHLTIDLSYFIRRREKKYIFIYMYEFAIIIIVVFFMHVAGRKDL